MCTQAAAAEAGAAGYQADNDDPTEIIVTAQKRSENIQDVPLSISAVTGETLERQGSVAFQDYAVKIPNLAFNYAGVSVFGSQTIALRGIYGVNTTGFYLDESPLPQSVDTRIIDLERIEVLRGPQGTLYGARSMGGTVRFITSQPNSEAASGMLNVSGANVSKGDWDGSVSGSINLPLSSTIAARATAFYDYESGVFDRAAAPTAPVPFAAIKNLDDRKRWGGSLALRMEADEGAFVLTPRVLIQRQSIGGRPYADLRPDNFQQLRDFNNSEKSDDAYELYTLNASYDTGVGTIVSASSLFNRVTNDAEDISELAGPFFGLPVTSSVTTERGATKAFSQELRFASDFEGPFQITIGGFYQNLRIQRDQPDITFLPFIQNVFSQFLKTKTEERAAFAEASFAITPELKLIAGARAFDNRVTITAIQDGIITVPGTFNGNQKEKGINPKFGLQFEPSDDLTLYANAAKGFRTGGANTFPIAFCESGLRALGFDPANVQDFKSDSLWSYELGAKASLADRRVKLSGAVFQIDWNDIQQAAVIPTCGFGFVFNAGKARSRGFELESSVRLGEGLNVTLGLGHADATILQSGVSSVPDGARVQQVPKWTVNGSFQYDFSLGGNDAYLNTDFGYTSNAISRSNGANRLRPSYTVVGARAGVKISDFELAIFAKNLFDVHANFADVVPLGAEIPGRPRFATNRPRTLGAEVRYRF
jgi:outer membrane receptor protein involved in Fe transport